MDRVELARVLAESLAGAPSSPRLRRASRKVAAPAATPVVIKENDPRRFMSALAAAAAGSLPVFLADPAWTTNDRARLRALCAKPAAPDTPRGRGWLCIPSGGSSGALKLARHDQGTIAAAVRGFGAHFGVRTVNAVGVLPLYHVSGLMAWMRCALTAGRYEPWAWKDLSGGRRPKVSGDDWFVSLVPTQLQRLLASRAAVAWLRRFRAVFVGGGPVWPELAEAAAKAKLPVSLSYGMTETAAMVAALQPEEFLAGARGCGRPLPHARVTLTRQNLVRVAGKSLFHGYWPEWRASREFVTSDFARLDHHGHVQILGRSDAMIITGGRKVSPMEIEAALRGTGEFTDVAVVGVPDAEWGARVVACYPAGGKPPNLARVKRILAAMLGPHLRPKQFAPVSGWPRNAQGKLNRAALLSALQTQPGGTR